MTDQNRFPLEEKTLAIDTESIAHQKDGPAQSELQEKNPGIRAIQSPGHGQGTADS